MNKEIQAIRRNIQNTLEGTPWYGRPVYELLDEVDPASTWARPGATEHSLIELLYHMITWAGFTLKRIEGDKEQDLAAFEKMDWREIDPKTHTWQNGLKEFKEIHQKILELLQTKEDSLLKEIVDYRQYNFRFLLNGLIQHNIYHLGQIAYVKKLLEKR